ncbi:hypothetical protein KP509_03G048300 [Ceratopteris richardii]|uniref:NADAR domain-containing protein n=1 Tax=Ceratopteris richardii TaxID=49495 RepID=A0A8T2V2Q1_CERRI|nr:hypothetical protein KP509_03G048300 [Ceratopteris richardii]
MEDDSGVIQFYSHREPPFGCFSNFYAAEIIVDGKQWPTTEHYFQAMKFANDPMFVERVRTATTPHEAAALGRGRRWSFRADWDMECLSDDGRVSSARLDAMRVALRAKFDQHPELRQILLSTRGCKLVEHTRNDRYWGDGGDGYGKNMLGRLLMELREILISEAESGKG